MLKAFFLFFLCLTLDLYSQNKLDNVFVSAAVHRGFVLPEYSNFTYLVNKPVQAFSLNYFKKSHGKNLWQQLYGYPDFGISLYGTSLGNAAVNGYEISVFPYIQLSYPQKAKKIQGFTQLGIGLGFTNKKYSAQNYQNVAVGSHVNIHFNLKTGIQAFISQKIQLQAGLSFDHLSNANLQEPNLGINSVTTYVSGAYLLGEPLERQKNEITAFEKKSEWSFFYFFGGKRARALASRYFVTSSVSAEWNWKCARKFNFGAGLDAFFDSSTKTDIEKNGGTFEPKDNFRTGIHISQSLVYQKISLMLQEGVYVGLTDQVSHKTIYNKGIVQFEINKFLAFRLTMKAHLHILDYPEIGIGVKW